MAIKGEIIRQKKPSGANQGRVDFQKNQFDSIVEQKGYEVVYRKAIMCPCKGRGTESQSNCKNCGGTGWVFINPIETRMVLQSMNINPKYQEFGKQLLGTVNVSARTVDRLGRMDEITIKNAETESSEVLFLEENIDSGRFYAYTIYDIIEEYYVALFKGTGEPLKKLEKGSDKDYTIEGRKLLFSDNITNKITTDNISICIRYTHNPKYYIWEVGRDVMNTQILKGKSEDTVKLPVNAIGMRADLIKDLENYDGNRLLDNSFLTKCDIK